jgi:prepilin-type N-terminal cleavage/methylation domain-containing protein
MRGGMARNPKSVGAHAFTLIELLVVLAVCSVLASLLAPGVARMVGGGKAAACRSNLKQMYVAYRLYLDDHGDRLFPWREETDEGTLWYFGLERRSGASGEGRRVLDKSRARLAPYFDHVGGIEVCPAFRYGGPKMKQKFAGASYGYGLNEYLIEGTAANRRAKLWKFSDLQRPSETIVWGDSAQLNTWQAPASPANPMIEEWYYLSSTLPASFHFRHDGNCQVVMGDGAVRSFAPAWLDPRGDGLTGLIEPRGQDYWLRPLK